MNIRRKIISKKLLIYAAAYLLILSFFIWGMGEIFDFSKMEAGTRTTRPVEFKASGIIIINNIKNLLGYMILFPIFPVVLLIDFFSTGVSVAVSINTQGIRDTAMLLAPHGMIEIPNFILYTYTSGRAFCHFWKEGTISLAKYGKGMREHWKEYLVCGVVIMLAGFMEGVVTPAIYLLHSI